ncbi:acetyltransferase [uncultured Thiohalocapsa sp.]|uniref:acetyltransferase n=1 Tax=uncultured Thiohalocapsa sp. TaxID=768990 RepID=UPI0025ED37DE|nr:acetyltransferase [uncultured Thiohalocapsa sp.]
MAKDLVIFGLGDIGQLAHFYFENDSDYKVAGFTVDRDYLQDAEFCGLPVVAFEDVAEWFPSSNYDLFIALSYAKLNELREEKYLAAKALGYHTPSYISSHATVLNEGRIGENCFILEDNTIQPFVTIGNNVVLWSGNHIGHHSTIQDHCFLASHIVVSGGVTIEESCFIGVNVTLRDHITVGRKCLLGAGTILLEDAAPEGLYKVSTSERARIPSTKLKRI